MSNMSIREFLRRWDAGEFNSSRQSMCDAGWYDWFCTDYGLWGRLNKMIFMIKKIAKSPKIDQDTMYVFFKNNCPMVGGTYDDFRICDLETGNVLYTICPRAPQRSRGKKYLRGRYIDDAVYRTEVWDFVVSQEELSAIHVDNLAKGIPVDYDEQVVLGYKKDAYRYFGV